MAYVLIAGLVVLGAYLLWLWNRRSGRHQIPLDTLPDTFVVFDLETTGLKAEVHEIIEVAAIRFRKGEQTHDTYQALVKPRKPVPKKITDLTGITQAMVDTEGQQLDAVLEDFRSFAGELRLVSFNADFDMAFLQAAMARTNKPVVGNPVSCALKMSRRAWPRRKSFRLDDLARDGNIVGGKAHRALEDARRALIVYAAAAAKLKSVA